MKGHRQAKVQCLHRQVCHRQERRRTARRNGTSRAICFQACDETRLKHRCWIRRGQPLHSNSLDVANSSRSIIALAFHANKVDLHTLIHRTPRRVEVVTTRLDGKASIRLSDFGDGNLHVLRYGRVDNATVGGWETSDVCRREAATSTVLPLTLGSS